MQTHDKDTRGDVEQISERSTWPISVSWTHIQSITSRVESVLYLVLVEVHDARIGLYVSDHCLSQRLQQLNVRTI